MEDKTPISTAEASVLVSPNLRIQRCLKCFLPQTHRDPGLVSKAPSSFCLSFSASHMKPVFLTLASRGHYILELMRKRQSTGVESVIRCKEINHRKHLPIIFIDRLTWFILPPSIDCASIISQAL